MSFGVGCRHSLDPVLLWLWCRLTAAAPVQPLASELPHATNGALKGKRERKEGRKEKNKKKKKRSSCHGSAVNELY